MTARRCGTVINIYRAVFASEPSGTHTPIIVHAIHTNPLVLAKLCWDAIIDVNLTQLPCKACFAHTSIRVNPINAGRVVVALMFLTVVNVCFTVVAAKSGGALAFVVVDKVLASGIVVTRRRCTIVDVYFACTPLKSRNTVTLKLVDKVTATACENKEEI